MNKAFEKIHRYGKAVPEIFKTLQGSVSRSGVFQKMKRFKKTRVHKQ